MRALALLVWLLPSIALADPIELSIATRGSNLELTFKNIGKTPVTMTTHVRAGNDHYDWLNVELKGKTGRRTLELVESRTKAIPVDETIAAGGSLTRKVDLVWWSIRGSNTGGPIEPGTYEVLATWNGKQHKLSAKTTWTLPAPRETGCKEAAGINTAKLELLAQQVDRTASARVGLHNTDTVVHCIHGIIRTHETQNDWLRMTFQVPGETTERAIGFSGSRDKSYPVAYELPPGATLWGTWDLADWHKRDGKTLPAKTTLWITATWDASRTRDVWRGQATTGFGLRVP